MAADVVAKAIQLRRYVRSIMAKFGGFGRRAQQSDRKFQIDGESASRPQGRFMKKALKRVVVPELRRMGFSGTWPDFRRCKGERLAIMSFQFDKWGGGFTINLAIAPAAGFITHAGTFVPPDKLNAYYSTGPKTRIQPGDGSGTQDWFRFDRPAQNPTQDIYDEVAHQVLPLLRKAEDWYARIIETPMS